MTQAVIVASKNPVKIDATRLGFEAMFPDTRFSYEGISVLSGVAAQPMSSVETLQGATNRMVNAAAQCPDNTFVVGIEGGIEVHDSRLAVFAWVVVQSKEQIGQAQTGVFFLPDEIAQLVLGGMELGEADDIAFGQPNTKQQNGSIGLLTDNAMTRTSYYVDAVIMALIPFKKPQFTWR